MPKDVPGLFLVFLNLPYRLITLRQCTKGETIAFETGFNLKIVAWYNVKVSREMYRLGIRPHHLIMAQNRESNEAFAVFLNETLKPFATVVKWLWSWSALFLSSPAFGTTKPTM
ncbi:hypothetical protein TNCV_789071 [Trichonephila clavipes]|nr:hypothetical protein TNCV_789071 [Trichonephila clavipes]